MALIAVVIGVLSTAGPAVAQTGDTGGGTYGFNDTCEQLDGIGLGPVSIGDVLSTACKVGNAATHPGQAVEAIKDKAWDSTFGKIVETLMSGLGQALVISVTWWTRIPNSALENSADLFIKVREYTDEIQIYALVASIILGAWRIGSARMRAAADETREMTSTLARTIFATWMFAAVVVLGTRAGDAFADWVIIKSTDGNAKGIAEAMFKSGALLTFSPGLIFIISAIGMIGALAQAVFMVIRQALLVLVVAVFPTVAALSGSKMGKQSFERLAAWALAFLLYKPVAAIVYMIAFTTFSESRDLSAGEGTIDAAGAQRALVALVLMCSAALVLPALLKLVTPISGFATGASGAAVAGGVLGGGAMAVGLGSKMASGAVNTGSSGSVNSPGGGGPRPSGAMNTGSSGGGGPRPPGGSPGGGGGGSAAAMGSKGAAAGGPYGAAAMAAAKTVGAGVRAGQAAVNNAAAQPPSGGAPPPGASGGGSNPPRNSGGTSGWTVNR
ncbi:hypothetical protein ACFVVM_32875 [Nocardia sp. NPDC058176]|uniref:hypothetical protein n=1 Tax=Nocardia sp. NPDC058176 TaxID=3346368 RepID=UPI0036D8DA72